MSALIAKMLRLRRPIWTTVGRLDPRQLVLLASDHAAWFVEHGFAVMVSIQAAKGKSFVDLSADRWLVYNNARPGDRFRHPVRGRIVRLPLESEGPAVSVRLEETRESDAELGGIRVHRRFVLSFGGDDPAEKDAKAIDALRQFHRDTHPLARLDNAHSSLERLRGLLEYDEGLAALAPAIEARLRAGPEGQLLARDSDTIEDALREFNTNWERGLRRLHVRDEARKRAARMRRGGAETAKVRKREKDRRDIVIRNQAEKLLSVNPTLSASDLARRLGERGLGGKEAIRKMLPRLLPGKQALRKK